MNYDNFIQDILNTRGRFNIPDGEYKERHHIIPKCMGGSNNKDNLIDLYPEEHYDAHRLLFEENLNNFKIAQAWYSFSMKSGDIISRDEFAYLRQQYCKLLSENRTGEGNPMYGRTQSEKQKAAASLNSTKRSKEECVAIANKGADTRRKNGNLPKLQLNPSARKVRCIETGEEFNTIKEAKLAGYIGNIGKVCMGKLESCGGYHWEYCDGKGIIPGKGIHKGIKMKYYPHKRVQCIETREIFDNYNIVGELCNCSGSTVRNRCKDGKPLNGYHYISIDK